MHHLLAILLGAYECWKYGPGTGRTHDTDAFWSECYDYGMNWGDLIALRRPAGTLNPLVLVRP